MPANVLFAPDAENSTDRSAMSPLYYFRNSSASGVSGLIQSSVLLCGSLRQRPGPCGYRAQNKKEKAKPPLYGIIKSFEWFRLVRRDEKSLSTSRENGHDELVWRSLACTKNMHLDDEPRTHPHRRDIPGCARRWCEGFSATKVKGLRAWDAKYAVPVEK